MIDKNVIGRRMKMLRESKGWSQKDTAKKLGKTQSTYAGWENTSRIPPTEMLPLISEKLETNLDYLYGLSDSPTHNSIDEVRNTVAKETVLKLLGIDLDEARNLPPTKLQSVLDFYKFQLKTSIEEERHETIEGDATKGISI